MDPQDSLLSVFAMAQRRAPEYFDLLSAQTEREFDNAFDTFLEQALGWLETESKVFAKLDENGLTGILVGRLTLPGLTVTRETNSNGHVDITVTADHCSPIRKKLGEAKIYRGPAYHVAGLKQLLGRYTRGRECSGFIVIYHQGQDITGKTQGLRKKMDTELPFEQQGTTMNSRIKWSFQSAHKHSSGEVLKVGHVGCNMYVETPMN